MLIIGLVVLGCVVFFVLLRHQAEETKVADNTKQMSTPTVLVTKPKIGPAEVHIVLPGTVSAQIESSVYAQVSGYIKDWKFDIGSKVKAGDILADIDTPVTDQSLLQAGESVKLAEANLALAKVTAARYNDLLKTNAVSQQDVDNFNAQEKVQEANVSGAKAFESGIQKTEAFKQVRAPFDGVITARRVDVGDFVSATGQTATTGAQGPSQTGTPNQEMFRIAQTKILRTYVNVPEQYAAETRPGVKASVVLASAPAWTHEGFASPAGTRPPLCAVGCRRHRSQRGRYPRQCRPARPVWLVHRIDGAGGNRRHPDRVFRPGRRHPRRGRGPHRRPLPGAPGHARGHVPAARRIARLVLWASRAARAGPPAAPPGGDLLSRIRSDIDSLDTLYLRVFAPSVAAVVSVALMLGFLAHYSFSVTWIEAAGLSASGIALPLAAQRFGRDSAHRAVSIRAELRSILSETVQGLGELLIAQAAGRQIAAVAQSGIALVGQQRLQAWIAGASTALSGLVAQLALWGALIVTIPLIRAGSLTGPDLAMVALFVLASFEAVAPLPAAFLALGETLAAARRIFALVDAAPAVIELCRGAPLPQRFDIRIRDLRMRYADDAPWALDGLDLDVAQGEAIGIVGASGSGKTSILNVLLRFWDYDGDVTIGGTALRDLDGQTARSLFAVVSQQTHLFNISVRENLRLARPDATDAELREALRAAHLEDDIANLPAGLDTLAGENGARFSGGQARRLAIARAILKDAPILLLDEPTEGLDAASERAVLDALAKLMQGRTTLLITHRPAALRIVSRVSELRRGHATIGKPEVAA